MTNAPRPPRRPTALALLAVLVAAPAVRAVAAPPAGDAIQGRVAFQACASCHQVGPAARAGFGPPLDGLLNRRAGSAPGYAYSAAMRASTVVWTPETLAAFIRDPGRVVPGTKMRFSGFGYGEAEIRNIVAYIAPAPPSH